jgi:hypothetical protein
MKNATVVTTLESGRWGSAIRGDVEDGDRGDLCDGGQVAIAVEAGALRACAEGYYGECWDDLDEAAKIDPEGEKDPVVQDARAAIAADHATDVCSNRTSRPSGR